MAEYGPVVLVVEDDTSVREALVRLLDASGIAAKAYASAEALLDADLGEPAGCFILDIRMPGMSGLTLFQHLRKTHAECPVIFLTGHGDIPMAVKAVKDGAFEFLTKPVDEGVLLGAVQRALAENELRRARQDEIERARALIGTLTPRELDVLRHLITGAMNKEVGSALGIAEKTVKIHRANLRAKLGASSVVALVELAGLAGVEPALRT